MVHVLLWLAQTKSAVANIRPHEVPTQFIESVCVCPCCRRRMNFKCCYFLFVCFCFDLYFYFSRKLHTPASIFHNLISPSVSFSWYKTFFVFRGFFVFYFLLLYVMLGWNSSLALQHWWFGRIRLFTQQTASRCDLGWRTDSSFHYFIISPDMSHSPLPQHAAYSFL